MIWSSNLNFSNTSINCSFLLCYFRTIITHLLPFLTLDYMDMYDDNAHGPIAGSGNRGIDRWMRQAKMMQWQKNAPTNMGDWYWDSNLLNGGWAAGSGGGEPQSWEFLAAQHKTNAYVNSLLGANPGMNPNNTAFTLDPSAMPKN